MPRKNWPFTAGAQLRVLPAEQRLIDLMAAAKLAGDESLHLELQKELGARLDKRLLKARRG
jgi:hypothetical protein